MAARRDLIGPLALLVIGVVLLLRNLGYIPFWLDLWWPAILILIGLAIVFRRYSPGETMTPGQPGLVAPSASPVVRTKGRHYPPTGGLILIGLGLALLVGNLLGGRSTGPLIVIALGVALLIARISRSE